MIFVRDKGRMCNNILQYGHLYAWGREHKRLTVSMRFAYKYQYFKICNTRYHHFAVYVFAKYASKWGLIPVVRFDDDGVDYSANERKMLNNRMIVVEGWYVRFPELFIKYKDEIKDLFEFDLVISEKIDKKLEKYNCHDIIRLGVHIRRGDYAKWKGGKYLYSDQQYISIIRNFIEIHHQQNVVVFICGNDPSIDKNCFINAIGQDRVLFPDGNPGEDLCLLSKCDYLIGAPSTFSLVAAMYRDLPLYWIENASDPLTENSFQRFNHLFRHIL
jgi:hypothetical protein